VTKPNYLSPREAEVVTAAIAKRSETHVHALRRQSDTTLQYLGGLKPNNDFTIDRIEDAKPEGLFYAQMDAHARSDIWHERCSIDMMVNWLWEFSNVLHFQQVHLVFLHVNC
jgi:hypothetical protein